MALVAAAFYVSAHGSDDVGFSIVPDNVNLFFSVKESVDALVQNSTERRFLGNKKTYALPNWRPDIFFRDEPPLGNRGGVSVGKHYGPGAQYQNYRLIYEEDPNNFPTLVIELPSAGVFDSNVLYHNGRAQDPYDPETFDDHGVGIVSGPNTRFGKALSDYLLAPLHNSSLPAPILRTVVTAISQQYAGAPVNIYVDVCRSGVYVAPPPDPRRQWGFKLDGESAMEHGGSLLRKRRKYRKKSRKSQNYRKKKNKSKRA